MIYALDSNTISYMLLKEGEVGEKFLTEIIKNGNGYAIPFIVVHEVKRWLHYNPTKAMKGYNEEFHRLFQAVKHRAEMPQNVWEKATDIYILLKSRGQLIGNSDILIASYCIVNDYTLVSRNINDFGRIDGLKLVNWF